MLRWCYVLHPWNRSCQTKTLAKPITGVALPIYGKPGDAAQTGGFHGGQQVRRLSRRYADLKAASGIWDCDYVDPKACKLMAFWAVFLRVSAIILHVFGVQVGARKASRKKQHQKPVVYNVSDSTAQKQKQWQRMELVQN